MNTILFKVLLFFSLPVDQVEAIELHALKYDITVEMLLEAYIRERLSVEDSYIEVVKADELD